MPGNQNTKQGIRNPSQIASQQKHSCRYKNKGGTIQNSFGGTVIDLRRTTLPEGETFLDIDCTFGGIEIYVPSDWKVVFRCTTCLGGCQDKRFGGGMIDQNRILVIRGDLTFGGIDIKS